MPKLHFKSTPEEEAVRKLRKKKKKEERRKRHRTSGVDGNSSTSKRRRTDEEESWRKWASSDDDDTKPGPSNWDSYKRKPDYDTICAEVEEQRFRHKMFNAMEDDERLDSIEAHFNDYAHIPDRWRQGGNNRMGIYTFEGSEDITDCKCANPQYMDDEEYTEWVRMGMYRLKHAEEYAEQQRRKASYAARAAEEKARKEETARLEKAAEEERKRRKREREMQQWLSAREYYDQRWKELFSGVGCHQMAVGRLKFVDIPWPVLGAFHASRTPGPTSVCLDDLTEDAITRFLLPVSSNQGSAADVKGRKEKLKEAMLRFHPDKFEGRFMRSIEEGDQSHVREGIGRVVRVLNLLLGQ